METAHRMPRKDSWQAALRASVCCTLSTQLVPPAEVERRVTALLSSLHKGLAAAHAELDSSPVIVAVAQPYTSGNDQFF